MEHTKLDRVILGLHYCNTEPVTRDECRAMECPYAEQSACRTMLREEALSILEKLQPRLITAQDFEDIGEAVPCWKESRKETQYHGWVAIVYGKWLSDITNGRARYWTAKPHMKQMEVEPWQA